MEKLTIALISLLLLLSGCTNKSSSDSYSSNNLFAEDSIPDSIPGNIATETNKESLHIGLIYEYTPKNNIEKSALQVLKKYFKEWRNENYYKCIQYMYDDVFNYIKDQIPEMSMKDIKQGFAELHKEMNISASLNNGLDFLGMNRCDIVVSKLTSCVKEDTKIIMIGDVVWQFYGDNNNAYSEADPMLVISLDNGNSWKLASISIDISSILKYKFSEQSINIVSSNLRNYGIQI